MFFTMLAGLIGGIGLFLLGMRLMTEGLKYAAGGTLKTMIAKSTDTALHGLLTGACITALVQSSSAITVAIIGFVNAGMMNLSQAVALVYGSNIGTTMTGWLVATLGIKISIKAYALPAVGIGMLMRAFFSGQRRGGIGEAIAGFGLFFVGISELTNSFQTISASIDLTAFAGEGFLHTILFVLVGFLLTFFMQSSSAAMALALTAAIGGAIPLNTAAAMVIGANVGTTTTAVLATLDATSNAKRTAAAHVSFNLVTGLVALLILPFMLNNIAAIRSFAGLSNEPGVLLALFHTVFNILGVILFMPASNRLVVFLNTLFRSAEEDESRPRFLDKTVLTTPALAIQAMAKELGRIGNIALRMARGAISSEGIPGPHLQTDKLILDQLIDATASFSNRIQRTNLPAELDDLLPNGIRVSGYYAIISELALEIAKSDSLLKAVQDPELQNPISTYKSKVIKLLKVVDPEADEFSPVAAADLFTDLQHDYHQLKSLLLRASTQGRLTSRQVVHILETNSNIRRIAEQAEKAAHHLHSLTTAATEKEATNQENNAGPTTRA